MYSEETHDHFVHTGGRGWPGLEEPQVVLIQLSQETVVSLAQALQGGGDGGVLTLGALLTAPSPEFRVVQHQPPPVLLLAEIFLSDLLQHPQPLSILLCGLQLLHLMIKVSIYNSLLLDKRSLWPENLAIKFILVLDI